jgi:ATPase subunit of ABC transporter with duplicated ATPase domains
VYDLGLKVEKVMDMMGFIPEDGMSPVSAFSGGWRMRIGLGKILLQDPNILLLDEPTNHLVSVLCCTVVITTCYTALSCSVHML